MKGVERVVCIVAIVFLVLPAALGNPPLKEQVQYEQFCDAGKVSGTGLVQIETSMVDKRVAVEYLRSLSGSGDFQLDSEQVFSGAASRIVRVAGNDSHPSSLNLFESSRMTYSGDVPLLGHKYIRSKEFYGGIGAMTEETFAVKTLEAEQTGYLGSTVTATAAHQVGLKTRGAFNGTWAADSAWHKIFYKDIKSHQGFSGSFEIDRTVKLHEKASAPSAVSITKSPYQVRAGLGDPVTYEFLVKNTGPTVISDIVVEDGDLGLLSLNRTSVGPGEAASGTATYIVTEEDVLSGTKIVECRMSGTDNLGDPVTASCRSNLTVLAVYYPGGAAKTGPSQFGPEWGIYPGGFDLTAGNLTLYVLDVNMTGSRLPVPTCPYSQWPNASVSTLLQAGFTSISPLSGMNPFLAVWQNLSLQPGYYLGGQGFRHPHGSISEEASLHWDTPYGKDSPNGGIFCTGDPEYDLFDLKMELANLGPGAGVRASSFQRVHKSSQLGGSGGLWQPVAPPYQDVPESSINKTLLWPFVLVGNLEGSDGGGTVTWSGVIVAF